MRFGVHIRMERGLVRSLDRAEELGCETVQLFSGSPSSWQRKPVDVETAGVFSARAQSLGIHPIIIHTPYLVNLAAPDDEIWRKSRQSLLDAMQRAPLLGASMVVTHIGSHRGAGHAGGVARICEAVKFALESTEQTSLALELGSGAGNSIGSRFEEIGEILACLPQHADRAGICIDTAHLWGAGYDISTTAGVQGMFDELDRHVGLGKLWLVHLNDTLYELGSHRDRHHHIGKGRIGLEGFRGIVNSPHTQNVPGIIETPGPTTHFDQQNLSVLRRLRETR